MYSISCILWFITLLQIVSYTNKLLPIFKFLTEYKYKTIHKRSSIISWNLFLDCFTLLKCELTWCSHCNKSHKTSWEFCLHFSMSEIQFLLKVMNLKSNNVLLKYRIFSFIDTKYFIQNNQFFNNHCKIRWPVCTCTEYKSNKQCSSCNNDI